MERRLIVKHVQTDCLEAEQAGELMDKYAIEWHHIDQVNWKESYPYAPEARFRMVHDGQSLIVEYCVNEETIRAATQADNGNVWEDSCCEMFLLFSNGKYYNFECNCAAKLLIEYGAERGKRERTTADILQKVKRWSSNGNQPFAEKTINGKWSMSIIVPVECFFKDHIRSFSGLEIKGNFYKCGDKQRKPHFLSWHKIVTELPDFHRPEFFGKIIFE